MPRTRRLAVVFAIVLGSTLGIPGKPRAETTDPLPDPQLEQGRNVFLTYCAGCHGFDGVAFLPDAPSFSMGDRLQKSDALLLQTIRKGRNVMPSWENKLADEQLQDALSYLRFLDAQAAGGNPVDNPVPEYFYIFPSHGGQLHHDWYVPIDE